MKTKRDLIKTISIIRGNLSHIESTGVINGTLLTEIERVMEEYAQQQVNSKGVCLKNNTPIECEQFLSLGNCEKCIHFNKKTVK